MADPGFQGANRINLIRPDAPFLARPGRFRVGVRTDKFTHHAQLDVLNVTATKRPLCDRPLTVETWYPAAEDVNDGTVYDTLLRDGVTPTRLTGGACRDAPCAAGRFALVVISHGYPGNRYLMAHLGENLASKGYVVAAVDHTDSLYQDKADFASTLVNRPLDQRFVIDCLADGAHPLAAITDCSAVGVIGYSMGAYGALVFGGAGVSEAALTLERGDRFEMLARHRAGCADHAAGVDSRVKAIVPIGPWGAQHGIWDMAGLAGISTPTFLIGGSSDTTSDYQHGIRRIFDGLRGCQSHLLTFIAAGHNAAAPIPAPIESWQPSAALDFVPFDHYADAVWDTVRMNNITQHFVTAFLGLHLKDDAAMGQFLTMPPSDAAADQPRDWPGFAQGTALGLNFETRAPQI